MEVREEGMEVQEETVVLLMPEGPNFVSPIDNVGWKDHGY